MLIRSALDPLKEQKLLQDAQAKLASYQLTQFPRHLWNASLHIFVLRTGLIDL
jgi:hypothetical protein